MTDLHALGTRVLDAQPFSRLLGAKLLDLIPGEASLELLATSDHLQQDGRVHGGVVAYLVDNAIAFAAGSLAPAGQVVTTEFKINYLAAAAPGRLLARASVARRGPRHVVCRCEVLQGDPDDGELVALALGSVSVKAPEGNE